MFFTSSSPLTHAGGAAAGVVVGVVVAEVVTMSASAPAPLVLVLVSALLLSCNVFWLYSTTGHSHRGRRLIFLPLPHTVTS